MKRVYIQGLWLILQVISTYEETLSKINIVTNATLTQLSSTWSKSLNEMTFYNSSAMKQVYTSSSTNRGVNSMNSRFTDSLSLSVISYSHMLVVASDTTQTTLTPFNSTQSQNERKLFNSTQNIQTQTVKNISAVQKTLTVQPRSTHLHDTSTKSNEFNSNTFFVQNKSGIMIPRNSEMIHRFTAPVGRSPMSSHASGNYTEKKHSTPHYTIETRTIQTSITAPQSSSRVEVKVESSVSFGKSKTVKAKNALNSGSLSVLSSNKRFLLRIQTIEPSRTISLSSSQVSKTERLNLRISSPENYALQNSTVEKIKSSLTVSNWSNHGSPTSSKRGNNNSYLKKTSKLFSTTSNVSTIFPETMNMKNILATFAKEEIVTTQITRLNNKSANSIQVSSENILTVSMTSESLTFSHLSVIRKESGKVTTSISQTELYVFTSVFTRTPNQDSDSAPGMPLYVLAICLPLALLLGFGLAFVYFKRSKEDQRMRYAVTVEIASENPEDYELKRMYSIIDVTADIRKDFLSGLESRKNSNATQLDSGPKNTPIPDQPV